ncbi:MAG: DUF5723 family protein [Balneolales bacterium]
MKTLFYRTVFFLFLLFTFSLSLTHHVGAQPVLSQQSISMGGGASYITGPAANFYNPANLMIRDNIRPNKLILAQGGFYLSEGIKAEDLTQDYIGFGDYFTNFDATKPRPDYSSSEILQLRFSNDNSIFSNSARFDIIAFGFSFTRKQHAFSLALRSRSTNSFEISRGWYDDTFQSSGQEDKLERTLRQNVQTYHELSLGFAREVSMVNGWIPGLNRLYFGIAPKLMVGGMFFDGDYTSTYFRDQGGNDMQYTSQYSARSVADKQPSLAPKSDASSSTNLMTGQRQSLFEPTGTGVGLDVGLTFVMSLDDDNSLAPKSDGPLRKSLRFSVSMTDIGFISYNEQPLVLRTSSDTTRAASTPENIHRDFTGQIGEFTSFISEKSDKSESLGAATSVEKKFNYKLPAALHLGSALQYNRFLVAVDAEYQISPVRFDQQGWHTRVGTEFRLLKFIPLRSGITLNPSMETTLGIGAGIDAGLWEVSVATQLKQGYNKKAYTVGLAVAALQFRF